MDIKEYLNLIRIILSEDMTIHQNQYDIWQLIINMGKEGHLNDPEVLQYMLKVSKYTHKMAAYMAGKTGGSNYEDVYWRLLLFEAQCRQVDSCFLYLEKNRDKEKKFYEPRREHFLKFGIIDGFQALVDDDLDLLTISMPPGSGKLLADDTPVLTRNGWKNHGDLVVGDEVLSPDGKFVKVQRVFPKDVADVLVTFSNGEKIQCHRNHEWLVHDRSRGEERIVETNAFMRTKIESGTLGKRGHRYRYLIPKRECVIGEHKDLAVPPYVLGAWLGDGTNRKPTVTVSDEDTVIVDRIIAEGYPQTTCFDQIGCKAYSFSGLRQDLHAYGLCNRDFSVPKRIPDEYLTASIEQRLELLAGLIDTDGTFDQHKRRYQYSTTDTELLRGFVALVSTFGWRVCVTKSDPRESKSGTLGKKPVYVVGFNPDICIPCLVERKQIHDDFAGSYRMAIVSVEKAEPKQGNCIQVEGGLYLVGNTLVTTHNSTAGIFFLASCMGWWPDMPNLASAHSGILTKSFYDGVVQILSDSIEYTWREIFPLVNFNSRAGTNSKEQTIDVGAPKRFKSLTCRAINATLTGATRCEKILYADDLCSGIEEALSRERMDKLWQTYNTDLKTRKKNQCKEIHIQTHWSTSDVVSRLKREHANDPRARFIAIPALDENGESNFEYKYGVGFTKKYFLDMKQSMDDVSFRCLYMNQPIEREGLLYHEDEIRRFINLPKDPPDAVLSIMDTKNTGKDFFVQPVFYKYGEDYYLADTICSDESDYEIQYSRSVELIKANHIEACRIESNNGGSRVAFELNQRLKDEGIYCNITENYTTKNKETKIIVYAQWVKQHVLFRDSSLYSTKDDYGKFMSQMLSYTMAAKNSHDDACDALAMFAEWQATPVFHMPTQIIKSVI